ncbi:MAG: Rne/Rng family ribonuclease [Planctomycetota bacterium]|nr:Rne/Rng family ribonuclease [Planctomycetota bacterium]
MLINAIDAEESRIAVVEDGVLQELHVEIANRETYLGNIYKGRVVNIEPSIGAAFVNFGGASNGFLHISDVLPAYGKEEVSLEDIIDGRARVSGEDGPDAVRLVLDDTDADQPADVEFDDDDVDGARESDDDEDEVEPDAAPAKKTRKRAAKAEVEEPEDSLPADEDPVVEDCDADEVDTAPEDDEVLAVPSADAEPVAGPGEPDEDPADEGRKDDDVPGVADAAGDEGPVFFMAAGRSRSRGKSEAATVDPAARGRGGRGGRSRRPSPRDRTPRVPIEAMLKKGQEVIVQVTKEGIGAKGPTLTTYVSLPGGCLVLMPSLPKCGVSRKIASDKERRRLKKIVRELDETGKGGLGFIVRTAGVDKTRDELERDRDYLKKIWELVAQRLRVTRAPALLYQESDLVLKAMRDLFAPSIDEVAIDSKDVFLRIKDFTEKLMPRMADRIKRHESTTPIFHAFGIEADLQTLYQPRVELPSGISIVIDQTEALVAIDVNSGKFKPGTNFEESAYRTNMEAISEISRQLRLRDLGGVIIIDFIDMTTEKHKRGVERKLIDCMRGDKARIKIGKISPFGMMELTRQRVGPGLKRTVFNTCSHCDGAGLSRTVQSKALAVLRDVRAILQLKGFSVLQVFVAPPVNDYLVNFKRRTLLDLEEQLGKSILVKAEPSYPVDVVHYRFLTADGREAQVVIPAGLGVKL